jgi:hypothetical protein
VSPQGEAMSDEAEQKAAWLLPCDCGGAYESGGKVNPDRHAGPRDENCCAAYYRPAIAAALRVAQKQNDYIVGDRDRIELHLKESEAENELLRVQVENRNVEIANLKAERDEILKPLLSESDLVTYYKNQMAEHRNNAIASRKRAEAAEAEHDAAYVRGLEMAKETQVPMTTFSSVLVMQGFTDGVLAKTNAIQAEIDKAKAGKSV